MADIFFACCEEKLEKINLEWINKKSLCIVLCSNGYPDKFEKNIKIKNLDLIKLKDNDYLFHAGTKKQGETITAIGGRVLNFVSLSDDFNSSKKSVLENLNKLILKRGLI